jgi:predicted nuclease of predicted toxin-antitoxin system
MDVHVALAITEALRRRCVDVVRAQEDGAERLDDTDLLDRASALQRVLFTQDDDFLAECAKRQVNSTHFWDSFTHDENHNRPMCSGLGSYCERV